MIIEIAKVPPEGSHHQGTESAKILDTGDASVWLSEDVEYDLLAQVVSSELVLKGIISVDLSLECSRCAEFYSTTVTDSSFLRAYDLDPGIDQEDVTKDIREAILLRIPHCPLCRQDCKGLCLYCGKNQNDGPCDCSPSDVDIRWSGLDEWSK